ncbi:MAG: TIGR04283 family arsenosugar biosynthesis glycosyltransferase [Planctomycetes bacterium]|nr:TIGR04283 family arsenosugar biosynthesis glycosyltransferase [Planctomycetota bacterium]
MRISIIIPTLNEAANIATLIAQVRALGECEILVVDGGSTDETVECAGAADMVLSSDPGRARQQNLGAERCRGDVLLFLHADCRLPVTTLESVRNALNDQHVVGGCFQQRIDATGWRYRLIESGNAWRVRLFKLAYGDQAIFVRRSVFESLGRFPELKLMEDVFLMKRLKHAGRFVLLQDRLTVSARRWQRHGIIRQTLRNWTLLSLALCGVSPDRLARFYPNTR